MVCVCVHVCAYLCVCVYLCLCVFYPCFKSVCGPQQDFSLITQVSNLQAAQRKRLCRRGKEGFSKSRAKEGKTRQERKEQE